MPLEVGGLRASGVMLEDSPGDPVLVFLGLERQLGECSSRDGGGMLQRRYLGF